MNTCPPLGEEWPIQPTKGSYPSPCGRRRVNSVTVHTHILVGRFHARMKICLHEYAKGAPFHEQKEHCVLQTHWKQRKALKARFCEWRV